MVFEKEQIDGRANNTIDAIYTIPVGLSVIKKSGRLIVQCFAM